MQREDREFLSGTDQCAAWFYRPNVPPPYPCVILAHGFGAIREAKLDEYAEQFAQAGLAALVFDYRHLGASGGQPRQIIDINKQLADWQAAIAYARTIPEVDKKRLVLWGTSFSGGHVIQTAAHDPEIAAVIAQVPFTDGFATMGAVEFTLVIRLLFRCLLDNINRLLNRPPVYIQIIGAAGSLSAMTGDDAVKGYNALLPSNSGWVNKVAARVLATTMFYRPIKVAAQIACPLLICLCEDDRITPAAPAKAVAKLAPKGELKEYPGDHFALYQGQLFKDSVAQQISFLQRSL